MSIGTTRSDAYDVKAPFSFEHILFPRDPIHEHAGRLARFLADLKYEDIPNDVVHTAKVITLDTIGCIVAGANTPLGAKILAAHDVENEHGCRIPGTSLQLAPSLAAKVNAWLADVLDYADDASGHPSVTVIPAALAMAEYLNATPKQFLAGVVGGYEAGLRVHDAIRPSPEVYRRFPVYIAWHGVAAGAAAMVVSGGSEEQFRSALGHAAANTCVPLWYVQYGRPAHALKSNLGQMALGGVEAATCARQDIIGPFAMLSDAERGFARMIGSDRFDPPRLSADLTHVWRTRQSSLKAYPSCGFLHTTIDAVSSIVRAHDVDYEDVDRLQIRCASRIADWFSDSAPASDIDAQMSVQYVAAMALLSVEPGREWYSPPTMTSPRVSELMRKIDIEVDPSADQAFWSSEEESPVDIRSSVTVHTKDGRSFSTSVDVPPGHWRRPLSADDVQKKFLQNVRGTPLEKVGERIIDATMELDGSSSLAELFALVSPGGRPIVSASSPLKRQRHKRGT